MARDLTKLTIAYAEARAVVILKYSSGWSDRILPMLYGCRYFDKRYTVEIARDRTPEEAKDMAYHLVKQYAGAVTTDRP